MVFAVDVDAGLVTFAYEPHPVNAGAVVYVFNRTQGVGVITVAEENGQVNPTAPFPGAEGNQVVITFELDVQRAATCVEIHDGPSSSAYECLP